MLIILLVILTAFASFLYLGLGKEGRANVALSMSVDMMVFIEDVKEVTRYHIYTRVFRMKFFPTTTNTVLATA